MTRSVLVLGDDSRSGLAVVRSLGRHGINVIAGVQHDASLVPYSRYVSSVIKLPSVQRHLDRWESELEAVLRTWEFDLVIPTCDEMLVPLIYERSKFERLARLAIPDEPGFNYTYYKHYTIKMAIETGVPVPTTVTIQTARDLQRIRTTHDLQFPLVVKPSSSKVWKHRQFFELQVRYVQNWDELIDYASQILPITTVLVQQYVSGIGIGQEFLTRTGVIQMAFQHERLHEPLGGGGSSYRKSVPLHDEMLNCSRRMLEYMRWTGVAMIEYKFNPVTNKFCLMEINGRFWGSLPLALAAGVDFPFALYQMLVENRIKCNTSTVEELYGRNIARDIRWFIEALTSKQPVVRYLPWRSLLNLVVNIMKRKERWDELTFDDPLPGTIEIFRQLCFVAKKPSMSLWKRLRRVWKSSVISRNIQKARLSRLLRKRRRILFFCRGNICRSPFAERYLQQKIDAGMVGELEVKSAGTYPIENRRSPEIARIISQEFKVNLDCHRSHKIDLEIMAWADAVLCMDHRDFEEVTSSFPACSNKVFGLGAFNSGGGTEILDPWGKTANDFRLCYKQISSSIDVFVRAITIGL